MSVEGQFPSNVRRQADLAAHCLEADKSPIALLCWCAGAAASVGWAEQGWQEVHCLVCPAISLVGRHRLVLPAMGQAGSTTGPIPGIAVRAAGAQSCMQPSRHSWHGCLLTVGWGSLGFIYAFQIKCELQLQQSSAC
jgi:hypothetical protein